MENFAMQEAGCQSNCNVTSPPSGPPGAPGVAPGEAPITLCNNVGSGNYGGCDNSSQSNEGILGWFLNDSAATGLQAYGLSGLKNLIAQLTYFETTTVVNYFSDRESWDNIYIALGGGTWTALAAAAAAILGCAATVEFAGVGCAFGGAIAGAFVGGLTGTLFKTVADAVHQLLIEENQIIITQIEYLVNSLNNELDYLTNGNGANSATSNLLTVVTETNIQPYEANVGPLAGPLGFRSAGSLQTPAYYLYDGGGMNWG